MLDGEKGDTGAKQRGAGVRPILLIDSLIDRWFDKLTRHCTGTVNEGGENLLYLPLLTLS